MWLIHYLKLGASKRFPGLIYYKHRQVDVEDDWKTPEKFDSRATVSQFFDFSSTVPRLNIGEELNQYIPLEFQHYLRLAQRIGLPIDSAQDALGLLDPILANAAFVAYEKDQNKDIGHMLIWRRRQSITNVRAWALLLSWYEDIKFHLYITLL